MSLVCMKIHGRRGDSCDLCFVPSSGKVSGLAEVIDGLEMHHLES